MGLGLEARGCWYPLQSMIGMRGRGVLRRKERQKDWCGVKRTIGNPQMK